MKRKGFQAVSEKRQMPKRLSVLDEADNKTNDLKSRRMQRVILI